MKTNRFITILLVALIVISILLPFSYAETNTETGDTETAEETIPETRDLEPGSELLEEPTISPIFVEHTVKAKAAVLLEMNSNTVIYQQNADERLYPASLTKIMTCMLALDYGNLDDVVTVSENALKGLHEDGSSADLAAGEELSLRNLLYCIMLSSANDACNVVAEHISGSIEAFVDLMNKKAAALGCKDTHFENPHGLHNDNHYSTASDLCIITRKALENQTFREISSTVSYTVPKTNLSKERNLITTNYLVSTNTYPFYYYPNASGVKTGFTSQAGRCLISTASDGNMKFLSIVLGAATDMLDDGTVWYYNFSETVDLFDYGFDNFEYALVLTIYNYSAQQDVKNASGRSNVVLRPSTDVGALLPKDYDKSLITTSCVLYSSDGLSAPLYEGEIVGDILVYYNGQLIGKTTLETMTEVKSDDPAATYANYAVSGDEPSVEGSASSPLSKVVLPDLGNPSEDDGSPEQNRSGIGFWPFFIFVILAIVVCVLLFLQAKKRKTARKTHRRGNVKHSK